MAERDRGMYGCYLDRSSFPLGKRMVVYLPGRDNGHYVSIGGMPAVRVITDDVDEAALLGRIKKGLRQ